MSKYIHKALLLYRVIISLLFVFGYGLKKLKMLINGEDFFYSFLGFGSDITLLLASIGELIAPIFIIIGYKTRFFTALPLFMMFIVGFGYLVINNALGSFLEPRIMGHGMGLSTLVVFVSLIFWGWMFGPIGMILCVPITTIIKIAFANTEGAQWVSTLLEAPVRSYYRKKL